MNKIFISYSHVDKEFADRLVSDLELSGVGVWFDKYNIKAGDSVFQKISEGLENNDSLILIMSPASISSFYVNKELDAAFALKARIFPVLYEDCSIPALLAGIKYIDFRDSYHSGLYELNTAIAPSSFSTLKRNEFRYMNNEAKNNLASNYLPLIPCTYCDGEGGDDDLDGHWITCIYCGGKGKIEESEDD